MTIRRRRTRPNPLRGSTSNSTQMALDDGLGEDIEELEPDVSEEDVETEQEEGVDGLSLPEERLQLVAEQAPEYSREYRLGMVHQMLLRKIPLNEIARQFGVSVRTIQVDRADLRRRLREEASNLDVNDLIGQTLAFYADVIAGALRIATKKKTPIPAKLAALRTAMQGKKESFQILAGAGVFDVLKFRAAEDQGSAELSELVRIAEGIMAEEDLEEVEEEQDVLSGMLDEHEVKLL